MNATITENGNGLPSIGELVYDSTTDTVYRITGGCSRISTNGGGRGNSVEAVVEAIGSAGDTDDGEWEAIESANYGVRL